MGIAVALIFAKCQTLFSALALLMEQPCRDSASARSGSMCVRGRIRLRLIHGVGLDMFVVAAARPACAIVLEGALAQATATTITRPEVHVLVSSSLDLASAICQRQAHSKLMVCGFRTATFGFHTIGGSIAKRQGVRLRGQLADNHITVSQQGLWDPWIAVEPSHRMTDRRYTTRRVMRVGNHFLIPQAICT